MATYKKKGSKSKSSRNKLEELENKSATAGIINTLDDGASKTEHWVATNQKYIFITIALVASLVFGYLGFDKFIQQPAEVNAMNEMHPAQVHFESANQIKNDSSFKDMHFVREGDALILYAPMSLKYDEQFPVAQEKILLLPNSVLEIIFFQSNIAIVWNEMQGHEELLKIKTAILNICN